MKAWSLFTTIMLAICLGAVGCAHVKGASHVEHVDGTVVSYGIYELKMKLAGGEPGSLADKKLNLKVQIIPELKEQSDIISIDSINKGSFGYEFIINGCGQRQISVNFIMAQGGETITTKTLQLKCGQKRLVMWGGWKDLRAQGRLNKPISFSAEYKGKQLFNFEVTFTEGQATAK
ncbi:MAG: hypothetical protein KQI62_11590 [Deltaproteobacteria bacterium]|nr:hypothetical protein [Deltaproteobacteria bacterium]